MILSLQYGGLSSAISQSKKLAIEIDQYCDELSSKIQREIDTVEGGMSSSLNDADYFIKAKINQLRTRQNNASTLALNILTLHDTAKRVDEDVERIIESNQDSFFKKNPELRAPRYQLAWVSFMCDVNYASAALGNLINGVIIRGEQFIGAANIICRNIRNFWRNNWQSVVVILSAVVIGVTLIVFTGGIGIVIGLGLIAGTISKLIGDVINNIVDNSTEWRLSSWESYVGSAIGSAAGFVAGASGNWVAGGALTGATNTLITSILERMTGRSNNSVLQISMDTIISGTIGAVVGFCVGGVLKIGALKGIDQWFGQLMGRNSGILVGSGSMLGSGRMAITNLIKGNWGVIGVKTIRNIVVATATQSFNDSIRTIIEATIVTFTINNAITPMIEFAKDRFNLAPVFNPRIIIPIDKNLIDIIQSTYKLSQYIPKQS